MIYRLFKKNLILSNSHFNCYKDIYYCLDATIDTSWMAPMIFALDFDDNRPFGKVISGKFTDASQYYIDKTYMGDGGITYGGLYQYINYSYTQGHYQKGDTVRWNMIDKKLKIDGITKKYYVVHDFVMSQDGEYMHLIAKIYDLLPQVKDSKLYKTVTSNTLKRLKR